MILRHPPSTLVSLQDWLADRILAGVGGAVGAAAAPPEDVLSGPSRKDSGARLQAYVGGYPARIREALAEAYPAVATLLGEEEFAGLARRYAAQAPTGQYSLDAAAADLESFIGGDALGESLPFLADLASLERAVMKAFHSWDRPPADLAVTRSWDTNAWGAARLHFQPSLAVIESAWPVHDLWTARRTARDEIDIVVEGRPQAVIVYRHGPWDSIDAVVRCIESPAASARALAALARGAELGRVMADLAGTGQAPGQVTEWFSSWAEAGLIVAISSAPVCSR